MICNSTNTTMASSNGSDWIRLVFAHPFPLNNGAPIASANFISDGKVQVSPYLAIHTHNGACTTNGGSVIQDRRVGTIQLLFQSYPSHVNILAPMGKGGKILMRRIRGGLKRNTGNPPLHYHAICHNKGFRAK